MFRHPMITLRSRVNSASGSFLLRHMTRKIFSKVLRGSQILHLHTTCRMFSVSRCRNSGADPSEKFVCCWFLAL